MATPDYLSECESMIASGSSTFHKAFGFLPSPERDAVYVLYAFCRMIDDSVDEPDRSPYTLDELESLFDTLPTADGHFIWPALRWLFSRYPISPEPFRKQMQGQRMDGVLTRYETFGQLEHYCYLVAGTVGEMLLPILHPRTDRRTVEDGIALGKSMQIVNIVRDIGEDWRRGRRYVPMELMRRYGCTEDDFARGEISPAFCRMLEDMMALADEWMRQGLSGLDSYPPESAFCVELAAKGYMAILDQVRANGYQVFHKRAVVGGNKKLSIMFELFKRYPLIGKGAAAERVVL